MPALSLELVAASVANLRRAIALLDLARGDDAVATQDLVCLQGSRANIFDACQLLVEFPASPHTGVSVAELLLKAELALAAISLSGDELSLRLVDSLLLQTRVSIESLRTLAEMDAAFTRTVPRLPRR